MKIYKQVESNESLKKVSEIYELINNDLSLENKMRQLKDSVSKIKLNANGEKELIEILMQGLGAKVYFPRKGDNSERFDAILAFEKYKAVVEIEIPSTEILDAPRNLLDDYAVLKCRKNKGIVDIVPVVICWDLPNKRTDYWNVVTDINGILGIKIKTISILALALHYWTNTPVNFQNDDYYLEYANYSMNNIDKMFKKAKLKKDDYPGYFSPFK